MAGSAAAESTGCLAESGAQRTPARFSLLRDRVLARLILPARLTRDRPAGPEAFNEDFGRNLSSLTGFDLGPCLPRARDSAFLRRQLSHPPHHPAG